MCTGTGKQRAAVLCSTPGPGIISKTSSMPVWVARDSNHKVRGVQQNRERPLRRDRAREEELEKERKKERRCKSHMCAGPPLFFFSLPQSSCPHHNPSLGMFNYPMQSGAKSCLIARSLFFRRISISPFQNPQSPE